MVGPTAVTVELAADFISVSAARRFIRENAEGFSMPPAASADLELMASELVTNAVEHGVGSVVRISLDCRDGTAVLTVESVGPSGAVGPTSTWEVADADAIAGRGLGIVRALATDLAVTQSSDRLTVTVRRHIDDP